ncbi:pilus assembly protein [Myxococcus sp. CA051A]|uniref:Pilus assembly protein n=1 Tax=Myxococcus llanfairpwllgwyngyllgogerychwyrndrobwllllantysiliogogogochensis TaxID=2590453 RepID=A0A540WXW3_9BACT|nr:MULTISPECIES: TadE family protein [Myxococcus]NTX05195.1 pilus assembly protein [Myxococcus sp. CA040A]NTX09236.1 pilus assembly protein [Myxococcus sp. CA056]NTX39757.1 pilus assembly protein [Myxococcus sp. CA033]NTX57585.1 pilus assembly protein [Myxococcus sp. CA039A]NTX61345.1 pilus assembly protein [Myxococcus sp. CA051A]
MRSLTTATQSGQAAVESAIVLPLFVFLILGTLQLGLMHQARLLTKYAAYKAVRAGSLHNANVKTMEAAALGVLLPILSSRAGGAGGIEYTRPVGSAQEFETKFNELKSNEMPGVDLKYAEVTVCGPTQEEVSGGAEFDFDDPKNTSPANWRQNHRTKLRIQLTLNYRLLIPFADWVIYQAARGREMPMLMRMGKVKAAEQAKVSTRRFGGAATGESPYESAAGQGIYIMPIRATYTMRMQSNLYLNTNALPASNACIFPFSY